jgi:hypothetical protein
LEYASSREATEGIDQGRRQHSQQKARTILTFKIFCPMSSASTYTRRNKSAMEVLFGKRNGTRKHTRIIETPKSGAGTMNCKRA